MGCIYKRLQLGSGQAQDVQVIKLVLQPELPLIGHNLLYGAWTKRGLIYVLYIYSYMNYRYTYLLTPWP
jgi:hypothetical protein